MNTPKLAVDIDAPTRITGTKTREQNTRAATQTKASENANIAGKAIAHKLAGKPVAKAKKMLLAKRNKDVDERRKQRLQEEEEAERILAEQRRRVQEAERRKEAELRVQQAAAEVMKTKHQMITSQTKYGSQQHGPTTYVLNSKPDDDESNDESRPKYTIPHWAESHIRENQLAMQRYIPEKAVYKFFDSRKCIPHLTEMFQNIDRSRLERTSSAI